MDWIEETKLKLKKKNKILFSDRSILLKDLAEALAGENRRVLILWALIWRSRQRECWKNDIPLIRGQCGLWRSAGCGRRGR